MSVFEFVFSLYSLLFGLALAQVFAGLGNTLQERHKIKIGWPTPLLGLFLTIDRPSFWAVGAARSFPHDRHHVFLGDRLGNQGRVSPGFSFSAVRRPSSRHLLPRRT